MSRALRGLAANTLLVGLILVALGLDWTAGWR